MYSDEVRNVKKNFLKTYSAYVLITLFTKAINDTFSKKRTLQLPEEDILLNT